MLKKILPLFIFLYLSSGWALDLKGSSQFSTKYDLNLATAGVIKAIHINPGQNVKAGDVLLELDSRPHEIRLKRAKAKEESLLPEVKVSEVEFNRAQELYDRDSLSQVALQNAENKLLIAKGRYESAQADTALMEYDLSQTRLLAPVDAVILAVDANVGRYIDPSVETKALISLADSTKMSALIKLSSEQWKASLLNKKATIKYRGKNYKGQVTSIGFATINQSEKQRAYKLKVDFETSIPIPEDMPLTLSIN